LILASVLQNTHCHITTVWIEGLKRRVCET
jgi:hypothetical protein